MAARKVLSTKGSLALAAAPGAGFVKEPPARPRRFLFVLLPEFSFLPFAGAVDPLRIANRMSGQALYRWAVVSETGKAVACSAGIEIQVEGPLPEVGRDDTVILCAGLNVQDHITPGLIGWLHKVARLGPTLGAICTGAHILAEAGLLDGRRATIHWENQDSFREEFDAVDLSRSIFVIDGNRVTAAGGTSTIDLMLALIAKDFGRELANAVADQLIHTAIRSDRDIQRLSIPTRIGIRHPRLAQVIARMEEAVEEPLSPSELAAEAGMSTRQLERLFRRYLGRSPKRYYLELRLARARNLLMQTDMPVISVALACGFTSPSHFSKCYRALYGITPYRERGAKEPNSAPVPEEKEGLTES